MCVQMQFYWSSRSQAASTSKQRHNTVLLVESSSSRYIGYGVKDRKLVVRFPVETRPFIFAEESSPNTTPMPASYSMGNEGSFTGLSGCRVTNVWKYTSILPHDFKIRSLKTQIFYFYLTYCSICTQSYTRTDFFFSTYYFKKSGRYKI